MVITQLRKIKPYWKGLTLFTCTGVILSTVFAVRNSWAVCMASDEVPMQSIEAAQYEVHGAVRPLADGTGEVEDLVPDESGVYALDADTTYQLRLLVEGNISSGYCTLTFTGCEEDADSVSRYLSLPPAEDETFITIRPAASCRFQYDYCWGSPEEELWDGEEVTLNAGEHKLVTMAVGDLLEEEEVSEDPVSDEVTLETPAVPEGNTPENSAEAEGNTPENSAEPEGNTPETPPASGNDASGSSSASGNDTSGTSSVPENTTGSNQSSTESTTGTQEDHTVTTPSAPEDTNDVTQSTDTSTETPADESGVDPSSASGDEQAGSENVDH